MHEALSADGRRRRRSRSAAAPPPPRENDFCNAEPAQLFVGQKADAAAGLAIRQATGADEVRWGPPRTPMTMDFLRAASRSATTTR